MEYENETIFVEIIVDNKSSFRAVQAKRTRENFFHIVSEPANLENSNFRTGDIVRCVWRYFDDSCNGGIVACSLTDITLPSYSRGDRVAVSRHAGWKRNFLGIINSGPETRLGSDNLYWIVFDEPQEDMNGDGYTYISAQILGEYLSLVA
jgi:hypothetical protein